MWDGNMNGVSFFFSAIMLSENQCGMETKVSERRLYSGLPS